jgi:1,4-dihydroxy-6-naphthoate synthase
VAREPRPSDPRAALASRLVGIPGELTTACLALRLYQGGARTRVLPFDAIEAAVAAGDVDVGLLIHEGQLTYGDRGLHLWEDLGEWWADRTGLPLPLGGNVVRRDLGVALVRDVARDLKASIVWGLAHRDETLAHAMAYARGMDAARTDRFVGMYVNDYTVDLGPTGRRAVQRLLDEGHRAGVLESRVEAEFVAA